MRLIDADKITEKKMDECIDPFEAPGALYVIEKEPTVEAVPVSWIKDWASCLHFGISDLVIEKMLKDWEAEDEDETN